MSTNDTGPSLGRHQHLDSQSQLGDEQEGQELETFHLLARNDDENHSATPDDSPPIHLDPPVSAETDSALEATNTHDVGFTKTSLNFCLLTVLRNPSILTLRITVCAARWQSPRPLCHDGGPAASQRLARASKMRLGDEGQQNHIPS